MQSNLLNDDLSLENLLAHWQGLTHSERETVFKVLGRMDQEELFINLASDYQLEIFEDLPPVEKRSWIRLLAPDDIADLLQNMDDDDQKENMRYLDYPTMIEVKALMAYAEDEA